VNLLASHAHTNSYRKCSNTPSFWSIHCITRD